MNQKPTYDHVGWLHDREGIGTRAAARHDLGGLGDVVAWHTAGGALHSATKRDNERKERE